MAKKRYSSVGVSVLLALLIPVPVLSDAPPNVINEQFRSLESEKNSTGEIGKQPQESSNIKPNNPSSSGRKIDSGNLTSSPVQKTDEIGKQPQESSNIKPNDTSPSGRKIDSGNLTSSPVQKTDEIGKQPQESSNIKPNDTSPSGRKIDSGNLTSSPDDPIRSFNQSQENQKNNPTLLDNVVHSSTLNSFLKNPFSWLLWLLLLGLLVLLVWWFRRRRQQQVNQYVDQILEQKISNNVGFIINKIANKQEFKHYIDQYIVQQIDQIFEQKIQNSIPLITHNVVNDNEELNQYINQRLYHSVINNTKINNEIVNCVANSTEINNKINKVYRHVDIKIESIRNDWNQTFISLVRQYVDELIDIIGGKEAFNILIANSIAVKVDELLNQIIRTKNELIVIMNDADRHLYEWTLGELIAIKGCLTDRQVLSDQLVSFSAELRTKLDCTPCVDIKNFERFRPISIAPNQQEQIARS
ncbi:hypothetical protein [Nostoc sp. ChiQUE01b]|uniref:hypothetical protein n=1 Tax=Nostoc sp. ChiQUE01b TaxID=3075376 RepID=UPI002AD42300|nr:hypothetical protein [Nostoc sp. ChiQUE01b]MDZ8262876.1 hypothetical protein [Nostoc sp. ChiQUE01b]